MEGIKAKALHSLVRSDFSDSIKRGEMACATKQKYFSLLLKGFENCPFRFDLILLNLFFAGFEAYPFCNYIQILSFLRRNGACV